MKFNVIKVIVIAIAFLTQFCNHVMAQDKNSSSPNSMVFSYSGDPSGASGLSESCWRGGAMLMTDELTRRFDGCRVTAIEIANGKFNTQDNAPIEIFFTKELNQSSFFSMASKMDIDQPKIYKKHVLSQPVKITAGNPFYAGFVVRTEGPRPSDNNCSYSVWNDGNNHTDLKGGFVGYSGKTGIAKDMEWTDEGYSRGMVCIRLIIEGDNLPKDIAELKDFNIIDVLNPGVAVRVGFRLTNCGINSVENVDVAYTVDGKSKTEHIELSTPIEYKQYKRCFFELMVENEGTNLPVSLKIEKVNGKLLPDSEQKSETRYVHCIESGSGFSRNMLVEEATGTGCGWCVRGIVGMDKTFKSHNDGTFIPISAHSPGYGEELAPENYDEFWERYITHNPTCLINRNISRYGIGDPSQSILEDYYNNMVTIPAIASIELKKCSLSGKNLNVESEVMFAMGENNADYTVAYVVTEDNVGPYIQANNYSGMDVDMDGWENLPEYTPTNYNFVARAISNFYGTALQIPGEIKPDVRYIHSDKVSVRKVGDLGNCALIGMLINKKTECVENSTRVPLSGILAVDEIEDADDDAPVEYFDLLGRKVTNPSDGIYIRCQGRKVSKVILSN